MGFGNSDQQKSPDLSPETHVGAADEIISEDGQPIISGKLYAVKFFDSVIVHKLTHTQLKAFLEVMPDGVRMSAYDKCFNTDAPHATEYANIQARGWGTFDAAHETDLFLDAVMYCYADTIKRVARTPEILVFDYTFKTNNRDYVVCVPCSADGNNKNVSWGLGLLSGESGDMTNFVFMSALPFLYGPVLDRVRVISTDNGSAIVPVVEAAIKSNLYGKAIHLLCYWHAVNLRFNDSYPKALQDKDNGTGHKILKWFHHIVWNVETPHEVQTHLRLMDKYVQEQFDDGNMKSTSLDMLQSFISDVSVLLPKLSLAYVADPNMTLGCNTSSRGESENRSLKQTTVCVHVCQYAILHPCDIGRCLFEAAVAHMTRETIILAPA